MASNVAERNRRSIRLKGYDYAEPGAYFITLCAQNQRCMFGEKRDGEMQLNVLGKVAAEYWKQIPQHFQNAMIDAFVIMPKIGES